VASFLFPFHLPSWAPGTDSPTFFLFLRSSTTEHTLFVAFLGLPAALVATFLFLAVLGLSAALMVTTPVFAVLGFLAILVAFALFLAFLQLLRAYDTAEPLFCKVHRHWRST
jgi:hypothetical protein